MERSVAEIVAELPAELTGGRVGFFWVVSGRSGSDALLASTLKLPEAEAYGEALTHPGGHYDFWKK